MRSFDDVYAFFSSDYVQKHDHGRMLNVLGHVEDLLRSKRLCLGQSHNHLTISKYESYEDRQSNPGVVIWCDGTMCDVIYSEYWDDGPYFRRREEAIRCEVTHVRAALAEMLARLKAEPVTPSAPEP